MLPPRKYCVFILAAHRAEREKGAVIVNVRHKALGWLKRRQAQRKVASYIEPEARTLVVFASQSGFAETIAWRTAEALRAGGKPARLISLGALTPLDLAARDLLFVVSTTGKGDAPDSARGFVRQMRAKPPDLSQARYGLAALGDSSYEHFCAFGDKLDAWLRAAGAEPAAEMIRVDNGDIAALESWRASAARFGALAASDVWRGSSFRRCRLVKRTWLNPSSPGAPLFHLALVPVEGPLDWAPGDIAEIFPGPASDVFLDASAAHRDYSLASIPADASLEIVVRQMRFADGALGIASRWLTEICEIGDQVALRIRENKAFHAPPADAPMILIGNGSGIAGIRTHLKARQSNGARPNWLLFGERTRQHDFHFADEIGRWREEGTLARIDLAFSRDGAARTYVQHLLLQAGDEVRAWLADGAAVYVCGAAIGMAEGVEAVLKEILGPEGFAEWAESGLYRRDVY